MLEKVKQIHKIDYTISSDIKSALFSNYAAYYEKYVRPEIIIGRLEEYSLALSMVEEAIKLDSESHDDIACAVDYNNKTVLFLNLQKNQDAFKCCKRSLVLLEPIVFSLIKAKPKAELLKEPAFNNKLYVLLMIYYNLVLLPKLTQPLHRASRRTSWENGRRQQSASTKD